MLETDWKGLSDARFEKNTAILELVESLAMESLSLKEHKELRAEYCYRHSISDRTIRNYITRYKKGGAKAFLEPIVRKPSPRIHDQELAGAILELVKERRDDSRLHAPFPSSGNCSPSIRDSPRRSGTFQIVRSTGSFSSTACRRRPDMRS